MTDVAASPTGAEAGAGTGTPKPAVRRPVPASLGTAIRFMYLGALLSAAQAAAGLFQVGSMRRNLRADDPSLSSAELNGFVVAFVLTVIVMMALAAVLWVWMAVKNRQGRRWARLVGTLLFVCSTISFVSTLFNRKNSLTVLLFAVAIWLCGLLATYFMWKRESSRFYVA